MGLSEVEGGGDLQRKSKSSLICSQENANIVHGVDTQSRGQKREQKLRVQVRRTEVMVLDRPGHLRE